MKAKVKVTGQIIYDVDEKQFDYGRYQVHGRTKEGESVFYDSNAVILLPKEFQEKSSIDWEQRRYEIAKDLYVRYDTMDAKDCVRSADELIKQLKEQ